MSDQKPVQAVPAKKKETKKEITKEDVKKSLFVREIRKEVRVVVILFVIVFLLNLAMFTVYTPRIIAIDMQKLQTLTKKNVVGVDVNRIVESYIKQGRMQEIYDFYNEGVGNYDITYLLIDSALQYDIPIHLLMALAKRESGFNAKQKSLNENGTIDYGVMQLNSSTYKDYLAKNGEEWLLRPENNIRLGAEHLASCYKVFEDWLISIMAYNAGTGIKNNNVPWITVKHASYIMDEEKKLDIRFNTSF